MNIVTGIVLYAIIWFMTLFLILPIRMTTQADVGQRVEGTHASAPETTHLKRRVVITTLVAAVIWAITAWIIIWDVITLEDIDLFTRFGLGEPSY